MSQDATVWQWPEDEFIARMKRERVRRGWSQERMAQEVLEVTEGRLQMHPTAFTKLEREQDRRNLRLNEAFYISVALELPLMRMMTSDDLDDVPARLRELRAEQDRLEQERHAAVHRVEALNLAIRTAEAEVEELREVLIADDPEAARKSLDERQLFARSLAGSASSDDPEIRAAYQQAFSALFPDATLEPVLAPQTVKPPAKKASAKATATKATGGRSTKDSKFTEYKADKAARKSVAKKSQTVRRG